MTLVPLPIDPFLSEIVANLRTHRSLVLSAAPGAGKTTRVPPAILNSDLLAKENPQVVMLQPRRIATRASAERIAEEQGWPLPQKVGYQVRFENRTTATTQLRVITEAILTRQLIADPFLTGVGCVILDEFHERSIHTDLALALLKEVQQTVRPDLLLIVMSATLNAAPIAAYLNHAPILNIPGRTFPLEIIYAPSNQQRLEEKVLNAIATHLKSQISNLKSPISNSTPAHTLIFLPGAGEITRTLQALTPFAHQHNAILLPLHGSLPPEDQRRALAPSTQRKIILATNIAETSLTIDGITTVIDTGLARVASYDPDRGIDRLDLQMISQASATQRAGRAARTSPGTAIRLWSTTQQNALAEHDTPDIARIDLASTLLSLHAWGKPDPRTFDWFEPPSEEHLTAAEQILTQLGAIASGSITPIGQRMANLPTHPRLARMLLAAADQGLAEPATKIAALLSDRELSTPIPAHLREQWSASPSASDVLLRLQHLTPHHRAIHQQSAQLFRALSAASPAKPFLAPSQRDASPADEQLLQLILLSYPDRVARRRTADRTTATMVGNTGLRIAPESVVITPDFFVAVEARHTPASRKNAREATVTIASAIDPAWLEDLFPHNLTTHIVTYYDDRTDRVLTRKRTLYLDLLLRETDAPPNAATPDQIAHALASAVAPKATEIFEADPAAASLLTRIAFLQHHIPEGPPSTASLPHSPTASQNTWPDITPAHLAELLTQAAPGCRSLADLRATNLRSLLESSIPYPILRLINDLAPETLTVPTGNHIRLTYMPPPQPPILAVRLQELFGLTETPRLANGRAPVLLHLLAPNYRPVQVTADLKSFWANAYFEVRKDLRARYPKHAWPDNPLTAPPQAKGRPRR